MIDKLLAEVKNDSSLVGFYGGGNYGDELLLEILQHKLHTLKKSGIKIIVSGSHNMEILHKDYGYELIPTKNIFRLLSAILHSPEIVIGGGGIWGIDTNMRTLLLSMTLFTLGLARKRVTLIGVGYYSSTNALGKISAYLASKSSTTIVAQDHESYMNFLSYRPSNLYEDRDIAHLALDIPDTEYQSDVKEMEATLESRFDRKDKTILLAIRRFHEPFMSKYLDILIDTVERRPERKFIFTTLEPDTVAPQISSRIRHIVDTLPNAAYLECNKNPMSIFKFMQKMSNRLIVVGVQYHAILSAYLCQIPYMPIVYDNKVSALLLQISAVKHIPIEDISQEHIDRFINDNSRYTY